MVNGKMTYNIREYTDSWNNFAKPLEKALNMKLYGFDPDLAFMDSSNTEQWISHQMPVWFARRIREVLGVDDEQNSNAEND